MARGKYGSIKWKKGIWRANLKVQAAAGRFSFASFEIHLNLSQQMENVSTASSQLSATAQLLPEGLYVKVLGPRSFHPYRHPHFSTPLPR